jgi:hypothetical protein
MVHGLHGNGAAYAMRTVQRSAQLYFQAISQRLSIEPLTNMHKIVMGRACGHGNRSWCVTSYRITFKRNT